jgi:hypothetical protein
MMPNPSCSLFEASSTCEDVGWDIGRMKKEVRQILSSLSRAQVIRHTLNDICRVSQQGVVDSKNVLCI